MALNQEANAKWNSEEGWQLFVLFFHYRLLKGQILSQQPLSCTWKSEWTCSKLFATSAVACRYSYSPAVTETALLLQLQPCHSYSPAVTEAALLLQLQPCSYRGSPAVTVTALQLQRQPCCYSYSPAVTEAALQLVTAVQLQRQPCCYSYSRAVTVTAVQCTCTLPETPGSGGKALYQPAWPSPKYIVISEKERIIKLQEN